MDDAFIRRSRRLRFAHAAKSSELHPGGGRLRRDDSLGADFRPPYRRGRGDTAALPRKADDALIPADEARFWYIRRRLRLTTPRSFAGTPAIAVRSKAMAYGITRARTAAPFGVSRTTTSRLLVEERVRVTRPIFTKRVTTRDKVETSMLVRAATSIWRWPSSLASTASTRHIAMLNWWRASVFCPKSITSSQPTRLMR